MQGRREVDSDSGPPLSRGEFNKMIRTTIEAKAKAAGFDQGDSVISNKQLSRGSTTDNISNHRKRKPAIRNVETGIRRLGAIGPPANQHGEAQENETPLFCAKSVPPIMATSSEQGNFESHRKKKCLRVCAPTKGGSLIINKPLSYRPKGATQTDSSECDLLNIGMPPYKPPKRDTG